jgi:hypothetical protein
MGIYIYPPGNIVCCVYIYIYIFVRTVVLYTFVFGLYTNTTFHFSKIIGYTHYCNLFIFILFYIMLYVFSQCT